MLRVGEKMIHPVPKLIIKTPPRPQALNDFSNELTQKNPNMSGIATYLRSDLPTYGAALRLFNAPMFGVERNISSIERAAAALGLKRTFQLVKVTLLQRELMKRMPLNHFWEQAAEVAELTAALAQQFTDLPAEEAYMMGLFSDFGVPLLMHAYMDYKKFYDETNQSSRSCLAIAERLRYGFNHYDVGYELGKQWALPRYINQALSLQSLTDEVLTDHVALDESDSIKTSLALLDIAKEISDTYRNSRGYPVRIFGVSQCVLVHLGLTSSSFTALNHDYVNRLTRQSVFEKNNSLVKSN